MNFSLIQIPICRKKLYIFLVLNKCYKFLHSLCNLFTFLCNGTVKWLYKNVYIFIYKKRLISYYKTWYTAIVKLFVITSLGIFRLQKNHWEIVELIIKKCFCQNVFLYFYTRVTDNRKPNLKAFKIICHVRRKNMNRTQPMHTLLS